MICSQCRERHADFITEDKDFVEINAFISRRLAEGGVRSASPEDFAASPVVLRVCRDCCTRLQKPDLWIVRNQIECDLHLFELGLRRAPIDMDGFCMPRSVLCALELPCDDEDCKSLLREFYEDVKSHMARRVCTVHADTSRCALSKLFGAGSALEFAFHDRELRRTLDSLAKVLRSKSKTRAQGFHLWDKALFDLFIPFAQGWSVARYKRSLMILRSPTYAVEVDPSDCAEYLAAPIVQYSLKSSIVQHWDSCRHTLAYLLRRHVPGAPCSTETLRGVWTRKMHALGLLARLGSMRDPEPPLLDPGNLHACVCDDFGFALHTDDARKTHMVILSKNTGCSRIRDRIVESATAWVFSVCGAEIDHANLHVYYPEDARADDHLGARRVMEGCVMLCVGFSRIHDVCVACNQAFRLGSAPEFRRLAALLGPE